MFEEEVELLLSDHVCNNIRVEQYAASLFVPKGGCGSSVHSLRGKCNGNKINSTPCVSFQIRVLRNRKRGAGI